MAIKVIKDNSQYPKRIVCLHCGSVLEYEKEDTFENLVHICRDNSRIERKVETDKIFCPICNQDVPLNVARFIRSTNYPHNICGHGY